MPNHFLARDVQRCRRNSDNSEDVETDKKENVDLSAADDVGEPDASNNSVTGDGNRTKWQLANIAAFIQAAENHLKVL